MKEETLKEEDLSIRLGRIMDKSFNEIYIIDEATLNFTQISQSALQNIGYTMEEMASMTCNHLLPEMTMEQIEALFQSLRDEKESTRVIQSVHRRKDGTNYPVEVRLQLSQHETPPKFVAIVQDITERKKAEQAERLGDFTTKAIFVDQGYRGHNYEGPAKVHIARRGLRKVKPSLRRWLKRRSAIEPVIGHMKNDGRLGRNYLLRQESDKINAILCGAGHNIRKLLRAFLLFLFWRLFKARFQPSPA